MINVMQAEAKTKKLALTLECPSQNICTDKLRISRILLNLIGNAVKFTERGGIHIMVKICENKLFIVIKDTGLGISQTHIPFIFDKFYKVTSSYRTGQFNGAGLGLHITKQFIEELGGNIEVKSKLGKGTTFTCIIPLQQAMAVAY